MSQSSTPSPCAAAPAAYAGLALGGDGNGGGGMRTATLASGNLTDSHVVVFGGSPAPPGAKGAITIDATAILDMADPPNTLGPDAALNLNVYDGRNLSVVSAEVTGPSTAAIRYSRAAWAPPSAGYPSIVIGGQERTIESLGGNGTDRHTLAFGGAAAAPNATGFVAINASAVSDANGAALGAWTINLTLADGQDPSVLGAKAVSPSRIRVAFSEPIGSARTDGTGWAVSGGDAAGVGVSASSAASGAPEALTLFLDADLPGTRPDGAVLSYDPGAGGVADLAGNALADIAKHDVEDGMAPKINSAAITSSANATITFSEPVVVGRSASAGLTIQGGPGGDSGRIAVALSAGNGTAEHTLSLGGPGGDKAAIAPNATGTLEVDLAMLADLSGNTMEAGAAPPAWGLADGQAPSIASAAFTGPNNVTIKYTEPVRAAPAAYAGLDLGGGGGMRAATLASGNFTDEHVVVFGGAPAPPGANGAITINATAILDMADPPNALGPDAALSQNVYDGRTLSVVSAEVTGPHSATIRYTRAVAAPPPPPPSGYLSIAVGGQAREIESLGGNGTDRHTLAFDGAAAAPNATGFVAINASAVADADGVALGSGTINLTLADGQGPLSAERHGRLAKPHPGGIQRARRLGSYRRRGLGGVGRRRGRRRRKRKFGRFRCARNTDACPGRQAA